MVQESTSSRGQLQPEVQTLARAQPHTPNAVHTGRVPALCGRRTNVRSLQLQQDASLGLVV